jgi:hypothetical protein
MNFRQFDAIIGVLGGRTHVDDRVKLPEIHG